MIDHKKKAAEKAFQMIKSGQVIGLGDGSTVLCLAELIASDRVLADSLTLTTSSRNTALKMGELGLSYTQISALQYVDRYFDGCDQFDRELNALKSGSGIHTTEKILAGMAAQFILMGDLEKYSEHLTSEFPLVVEIIPSAFVSVAGKIKSEFPQAAYAQRAAVTAHGNYLLELKFAFWPELSYLNTFLKMLPGVLDHSLFYRMANKAVISGPDGTKCWIRLRKNLSKKNVGKLH